MGTEVLQPYDFFASRRLGSVPSTAAAFLPRRRPTASNGSNPNSRPHRRPEARKRREVSPKSTAGAAANKGSLEMGHVTILRRGESLDNKDGGSPRAKAQKEERRGDARGGVVLSSDAGEDLIAFGTGWLGPEPAAVPRQMRLAEVRTGAKAGRTETYAGSAFSMSPSPWALPLPTFSARRFVEGSGGGGGGGAAVDHSATRDLRRLLRLD